MNDKRDSIKSYIDKLEDHQLSLLEKILIGDLSKRVMMETVFTPEEIAKVDSSYPQDYQNELIKVIGGENCPNFCYSYADKSYGELVNLDRRFLSEMQSIFR
jgi:hypothetical protein